MKKFTPEKSTIIRFILTSLLTYLLSSAFAQNAVTTLAGSSQGYVDGTGTGAKFKAPTGICISPDGMFLYVADYSGHRIRKINTSTKSVTTVAGSGISGSANGTGTVASFSYPSGVCISSDGSTLYIADYGNSLIRKINLSTLAVTTIAGNGTFAYADNSVGLSAAFNGPTDIVNNGDSVLYISDTENQLIRKLTVATTSVSTLAGMNGIAGFQNGIGTNAAFRFPKGMCVSANGSSLYVADNGNNMIRSIDLTTKNVTTIAGDGTAGFSDNSVGLLAKLNAPNGVCIVPGNSDLLFVADNGNHRLRKISLAATSVSTVAGDGSVPPAATYADNTNGLNAKFFYPTNLVVTPDAKDIYMADQGNFKIRKIKTDISMAGINVLINDLAFQVYPNPSSDLIVVSMTEQKAQKVKLELFNSAGVLILKSEKENAEGFVENVSSLPAGIYILKLSSETSLAIQKIVIAR